MANESWPERHSLIVYFVLAYGITWLLSALASANGMPPPVVGISALLLHYGPALAAIIIAVWIGGWQGLGKLLSPLRLWRVSPIWYAVVLIFPLAIRLLAVGIDVLLGGTAPAFFTAPGIPSNVSPLTLLLPVFIGTLLQAGLAEEIGWRGFALPQLQTRYNALVSSLILGILWAFWHFHPQNWATLAPIVPEYILSVLCFTILMTWVYNNTNGSLLLVVLFHAASNTSDWIVPITLVVSATSQAHLIQLALNIIVVMLLLLVYGPQRLSRATSNQTPQVAPA